MSAFLYPLLLALSIPLALAVENLDQGIVASEVVPVLIVALCSGLAGHLLGLTLRLSRHARALVAAAFVLVMYSPLVIRGLLPDTWSPQSRSILEMVFGIACMVVVSKWAKDREPISKQVSDFLFVLVGVLTLVSTGRLIVGHGDVGGVASHNRPAAASSPGNEADIWLLVFDAYTSPVEAERQYGVDMMPLLQKLRSLGFQVTSSGRANYVNTVLSLAAMLNRRYLDPSTDGLPVNGSHLSPAARLIEGSATIRDIKAQGYEFVFFRSSFPPLARNRLADRLIPEHLPSEYTRYWLSRTLIAPAFRLYCWVNRCSEGRWPFQPESPDEIDQKIGRIVTLAGEASPRPRFVFAHFLIPHGPFRYDAECTPLEPVWPNTEEMARSAEVRDLYAAQVRCTNRKILRVVEGILNSSRRPAAILVQGDHGYGRFAYGRVQELSRATPDQIEDRSSAFGAYRLPDGENPAMFWDGISPVNVMKVVMSSLFGLNEPYLPDQTFWSSWDHPYRFTPVARPERNRTNAGRSAVP